MINFQHVSLICMAISILAGGVASHAPEQMPLLWCVKTVADVFGASGLAALFLKPPSADVPVGAGAKPTP